MYMFRTVFALSLVVLVLPATSIQRQQFSNKAYQAINNVATLCDRNQHVCATGSHYLGLLRDKSASGLRVAMNIANSRLPATVAGSEEIIGPQSGDADDGSSPAETRHLDRGTLRTGDLKPTWRGEY